MIEALFELLRNVSYFKYSIYVVYFLILIYANIHIFEHININILKIFSKWLRMFTGPSTYTYNKFIVIFICYAK